MGEFDSQMREQFETSDPNDQIFWSIHPVHKVSQEEKETHPVRVTLDLKVTANSLYFPGNSCSHILIDCVPAGLQANFLFVHTSRDSSFKWAQIAQKTNASYVDRPYLLVANSISPSICRLNAIHVS